MKGEVLAFYKLLVVGVTIVWLGVMGIIVAYMGIRTMWCNIQLLIERIHNYK